MTEWGVLQVIITVVGFLITIITIVLKLKDKDTNIAVVIQKNTDAINGLTSELSELSTYNKEDHDRFYKDINQLKLDVSNLKTKHEADVKLLEDHIHR